MVCNSLQIQRTNEINKLSLTIDIEYVINKSRNNCSSAQYKILEKVFIQTQNQKRLLHFLHINKMLKQRIQIYCNFKANRIILQTNNKS